MSYMQQYGMTLLDNDYPIIPIRPGTKKPGTFTMNEWRDYSDWSRHCDRRSKSQETEAWGRWPDCGIGVACGRVVAIDIDLLDGQAAHVIEQLARDMLGDTPLVRVGLWPKRMLIYRTAKPFAGFKKHPLEVLARGQQFVAYSVHPGTGKPYAWPQEDLAGVHLDDLPEVTEEMCREWIEAAWQQVPDALRPSSLGGSMPHDAAPNLSLRGTTAAIVEALTHIPNTDLDYDSWIKIGLALKGALGEAGEDLWLNWSAQSAKDDAKATEKAWRSFQPARIGAGTIYHLAFERGWAPRPGLVLNAVCEVPEGEEHPAAEWIETLRAERDARHAGIGEMLAEARATTGEIEIPDGWSFDDEADEVVGTPPAPPSIPSGVFEVGGVLQQLVEFIVATAIRPQPFLALGAALACVGVLMGRKYQTNTKLRSNLYVVGMAPSGGGKDHARKVISAVLEAGQLRQYIGGNKLASGSALLAALQRSPNSLFQIDEFGQFMMTAIDKKKAPKHVAEIWDNLTELYTSASGTYFGTEYADQKLNKRVDIHQPCCCLHATTVPGPFWAALQSGAMADGSLARYLIFETDTAIPDMQRRPASLERIPVTLLEALKAIDAGVPGHTSSMNNAGGENVVPQPYIVPCDDQAQTALDQMDDDITFRLRAAARAGGNDMAILARYGEQVRKLSMIRSVSRDPAEPAIHAADVEWAKMLVEACTAKMVGGARTFIADNDQERDLKRVLALVEEGGVEGLTLSVLVTRTRWLPARRRKEILEDLVEGGDLVEEMVAGKTKPTKRYRGKQYVYAQAA